MNKEREYEFGQKTVCKSSVANNNDRLMYLGLRRGGTFSSFAEEPYQGNYYTDLKPEFFKFLMVSIRYLSRVV